MIGGEAGPSVDRGTLLEGVVAFVEVRHRHANGSRLWEKQLQAMGAQVADKLTFRCTHLVFKEGSLATYKRAKKLQLHIVSASWVAKCKELGQRLNESSWPCVGKDKYDSPGKIRLHSASILTFTEDLLNLV